MLTFRDRKHLRNYLRTIVEVQQLSTNDGFVGLRFQAFSIGTTQRSIEQLVRDIGNHNIPRDNVHTFEARMQSGERLEVLLDLRNEMCELSYKHDGESIADVALQLANPV